MTDSQQTDIENDYYEDVSDTAIDDVLYDNVETELANNNANQNNAVAPIEAPNAAAEDEPPALIEPEDQDDSDDESDDEDEPPRRYPARERRAVDHLQPNMHGQSYVQKVSQKVTFADEKLIQNKKLESRHNLFTQVSPNPDNNVNYGGEEAIVLARTMDAIESRYSVRAQSYAQQYILNRAKKEFGQGAIGAAKKELKQQYQRTCFLPVKISDLTVNEKRKAQQALMLVTEKKDGSLKGRMVYNGKPTRSWLNKEDCASPTVSNEAIFLTAVVDGHQNRHVMISDAPNAFIHAPMPVKKPGEEKVIMKITGVLVDLLVEMDPNLYGPCVVFEKGRKVVYVEVLRASYGMLMASLLWYSKYKKDLEEAGFVFNPYDPCVANKTVKGVQLTTTIHVDDNKVSSTDPKALDWFEQWLNEKYGKFGDVKIQRGKKLRYLGMNFDYSVKGEVTVDMIDYVEDMLEPFKLKSTDTALTPAAEGLFDQNQEKSYLVGPNRTEVFHTTVAKGLFISKRARPDIQPTIAFLCTRVRKPEQKDWRKLMRLLRYLNGTKKLRLRLNAGRSVNVIKFYVDASFAVHPDFKSHTGAIMTFDGDGGAVQSVSRKQKLNSRSSTACEIIGTSDVAIIILWTKLFLKEQGIETVCYLYQDNASSILLETNGRKSA